MPSMTLTINATNYDSLKTTLLRRWPVPVVDELPTHTDDAWVKVLLVRYLVDGVNSMRRRQIKDDAIDGMDAITPIELAII